MIELETFYTKSKPRLLKFIRRNGIQDEAEDVFHDAVAKAIVSFSSWDKQKGSLDRWFFGILTRCMSDHFKERGKRFSIAPLSDYDLEDSEEAAYEDNTVEAQEKVEYVLRKIEQKNRPARDILYMRFIQGYTPSEIRDRTKMKYRTIVTVIDRFTRSLKD